MRFPNDTQFHLRMATLLVAALFFEHLAATRLTTWSAPQIGVIAFVLGLVWVAMTAFHHGQAQASRLRVLENRVAELTVQVDALTDELRAKRSLPR